MSSLLQSKWATSPPPAEKKPVPEHPKQPEKPSSPTDNRPTSSSTLSAAAPSFAPASPSAPPPDVSTVDEFAQTGAGDDDLFDDVIPFEESMQTRPPEDLFQDEVTPLAPEGVEQPVVPATRGRGDGTRARGRGRGRGRGGRKESAQAPAPKDQQQQQPSEVAQAPSSPPDDAPTGPKKDTPTAVRGDRRATGGIRKPKLTEAELSERMAAIQLKNASLTAAHARAEADAANFAEREQQAKARAKEERKDRQQMMGERERNRMRKLKAMEGREWDLDKNEDDFARGGRQDSRPGGFGRDQADYTDGREYLYREPRGGRGSGGRGGAARGGKQMPDRPPKQEDFPALPGGRKDDSMISQNAAGKSWAEQVETAGS